MNIEEVKPYTLAETRVSAGPVRTIVVATTGHGEFITSVHMDTVIFTGRGLLSSSVRVSRNEQSAREFHQRVVDEVSKFCERMEQLFEKGE